MGGYNKTMSNIVAYEDYMFQVKRKGLTNMSAVHVKDFEDQLENSIVVPWEKVYGVYEKQERPKWLEMHDDLMTSNQLIHTRTVFSGRVWHEGDIRIGALYPVSLVRGTSWIQRLACSGHIEGNCPNCTNPILEQVVINIHLNRESKNYPKILSIQEKYRSGELVDPFVIIVDDDPVYVYDGNSRLMSIASLPDTENDRIKCYLGSRQNGGIL